jgi:hypothetical protein
MQPNPCYSIFTPLCRRCEQIFPKDQIVCPFQMQVCAMAQHDGLDFGPRQAVDYLYDWRGHPEYQPGRARM